MSQKTTAISDADIIEQWEIVTDGTVWVWTKDVRQPGYMQKTRVGGKAGGSKRLRITRDERRYNEEQIIDEMISSNPFRNGSLKLIKSRTDEAVAEDVDLTYQLDNDDLLQLLSVRDDELFRSEVEGIASELILRRLYAIAEKNATVSQLEIVRAVLNDRFAVGGTQQSIREQDRPGYRGIALH